MTQNITKHTQTTRATPITYLFSQIFLSIKSKAETLCTCILSISFINYLLCKTGCLDVQFSPIQHRENVVAGSENIIYGAASLAAKFQQIQTDPFEAKLDLSEQIRWLEESIIKDAQIAINRFSHNRSMSAHIAPLKEHVREKNTNFLLFHIAGLPNLMRNISMTTDDTAALDILHANMKVYLEMDAIISSLETIEKKYAYIKGEQITTCEQIDATKQTHAISCLSDFQNVLINICSLPLYEIQRQKYQAQLEESETLYKLSFISLIRLISSIEKQVCVPDDLDELVKTLQLNCKRQDDIIKKLDPEESLQRAMRRIYKDIIAHHYIRKDDVSVALRCGHMSQGTTNESTIENTNDFITNSITHIRHEFDKHKQIFIFILKEQNTQRLNLIEQWFHDMNLTLAEGCSD